ncbi:armadillo-type protein [Mycena latifolia]|nr:armadillo-type protein [Mycena latifolia]
MFEFDFLSEIADSPALAFVKRNDGVPLTPETVEIYSSYLLWKYVSTSTKLTILEELKTRAGSKEDARVLIHSNIVHNILQLLRSSPLRHPWLKRELKAILWNLTRHSKSTSRAVREQLVALLRDGDVNDVVLAFEFLMDIANSSEGAQGVVTANTLPYLLNGLGSPGPDVRRTACCLMETLSKHQSTAAALIDINPCKQLVALSRQVAVDNYEAWIASDALIAIATWPDGAEAAVAAQVLDHVPKWLASPDSWRSASACRVLAKLAQHKSTAGAVMDPKLCAQLVTILELYPESDAACSALDALGSIAYWPNGTEAVVAAKVLDHITNKLELRYYQARRSTCDLLAALARHEPTMQAVARAVPRERLVALSRNENESDRVRKSAAKALQALDDYLAGAQAPTDELGEPNVL